MGFDGDLMVIQWWFSGLFHGDLIVYIIVI